MASGIGGRATPVGLTAAVAGVLVVLAALLGPAPAEAAIPSVFGGDVSCSVQPNGSRYCGSTSPRSTTPTFDGVPLDVNVAFPPAPASGTDGNYPLLMTFAGYNVGKLGFDWMQQWVDRGYAVFSLSSRGFAESCGTLASRTAAPQACEDGYIRMMDTRYEVRDAQYLAGRLVDQGLVAPRKIAAMGSSYGGGQSLALATLRNRVMLTNGSLAEWRSPLGTPMELAAAHPVLAWSDFSAVFLENASTLDYLADSPYTGRPGVERKTFLNELAKACNTGYCAPQGSDPAADLRTWKERLDAGEPYDGDPVVTDLIAELSAHHSAYGIPADRAPAPTLIVAGFTDDLVPVTEALRFYNRAKSESAEAKVALVMGDYGHVRAQIPAQADMTAGGRVAWMDHYVRGVGPEPYQGVTAHRQTCPASSPPGPTLRAGDIANLAPGEVRLGSPATQTVLPDGGDEAITTTLNPFTPGAACNRVAGANQPGVASYRLAPVPTGGYTLAGSPTVIADVASPTANSQLAARLMDVAPDGQATLVSRAVWRPPASATAVRSVFQLQANAWRFESGHVPKLELVPKEDPFWRASNGQGTVAVSSLELRLPVNESPGAAGGMVTSPAAKIIPPGGELAAAFRSKVQVTVAGSGGGSVTSTPAGIACPGTCTAFYSQGTPVTLTALAAPGSVFTGWSGACAGTGTCAVSATSTTGVQANFARKFNLRLVVSGAGTISSPSHGLSCATDCTSAVADGQVVSLAATPAALWRFAGWSGACSGTGGCNVTMSADRTATASFARITHPLTVTKTGSGSGNVASSPAGIACGATCAASFPQGTPVTLTADPGTNSKFTGWSGGGCSGVGACVVGMGAATAVAARFDPLDGGGGGGDGGGITPDTPLPGVVRGSNGEADTEITWVQRKNKRRAVTLRFRAPASSPAASSFVCRLDRRPVRVCESPLTYKRVTRGRHRVSVAAVDAAGRIDSTPATYRFKFRY